MTAKRNTAEPVEAPVQRTPKTQTYVPGSHTSRVRAEHDARRVELLARDDVLASNIAALQAERDDIHEALQIMSSPAANVVELRAQQGRAAE